MTPIQVGDELRAAAKLMRERAEAATPGPWEPDPGNNVSDNVRADGRLVIDGGGYARLDGSKPVVYGAALTADAAHIASWHPAVAAAVADWLDRFADPVYCYGPVEYDSALNIARAYLGTSGEALAEVAGTFTEGDQ